jgi:hypothetical protein
MTHNYQKWEQVGKNDWFDKIEKSIAKPTKFMDNEYGIFTSKDGKLYNYHFWAYPLINLPLKFIFEKIHFYPFKVFQITNAILVLLVVYYILFHTKWQIYLQIIGAIVFAFSSIAWYINWIHPEVFTACLVFMSIILFFQEKYYWAIILSAIASMQNPPIFLLSLAFAIKAIFVFGFNLKNILKIIFSGIFIIIPSAFYFYHFGRPNLIVDSGYLDSQYITITRFVGFFFDLDQGMIIGLPFVLIVFLFMYAYEIYKSIKYKQVGYENILILVLIGIVFFVIPMKNWNHGQSVVNRYTVWSSMIIVAYFINLLSKYKNIYMIIFIGLFAVFTQIFTHAYFKGFDAKEWDNIYHKKTAIWAMNHFPSLYNPDPQIFLVRTLGYFPYKSENVIIFKGYNNEVKKIMVYIDSINVLHQKYGFSNDSINKIKKKIKNINGWGYINY